MSQSREIIAHDLVKRYGDFAAVDNISFKVNAGEVYGFLGPNGAGKSTTVTMLTTLSLPTSGTATVGGFDITRQANDVRRISGVTLQDVGLDPLMTSLELLTIQSRLFGMNSKQAKDRAMELLAIVKLNEPGVIKRPVGKYSGGMRRRLDLAMGLAHEPEILFLDEPTTGLDPASRRDIWAEVRRLNRELGMTIFLTTQYLEEADELADRIAIMVKGKIAIEGQPEALKSSLGSESINVTFKDADSAASAKDELAEMFDRVQLDRRMVRLYKNGAAQVVPAVVNRLNERALVPTSLTLTTPTLDDVFLQVTGQTINNDTEEDEPAA
ncbi:MAG: ATP-binding cassette domain-containing protein [Pleurocapsa minor GSE-CHR-MK-17-07R]|jgi:ABC-2 type transport system ATP-binding protein|nr:ATP-binding cassette domain-containing protein [Pleurocapsa minor GSE-CHR-MK 17-07R]